MSVFYKLFYSNFHKRLIYLTFQLFYSNITEGFYSKPQCLQDSDNFCHQEPFQSWRT